MNKLLQLIAFQITCMHGIVCIPNRILICWSVVKKRYVVNYTHVHQIPLIVNGNNITAWGVGGGGGGGGGQNKIGLGIFPDPFPLALPGKGYVGNARLVMIANEAHFIASLKQ